MYYTKISKKILILIVALVFHTNFSFAETNLEIAYQFYDSNDYSNSVMYFKKVIFEDKQYDGVIFYRYAYSLEQNGENKTVYAPFYAASAYCFEKANDTEEKYYSYAVSKEEKLEFSHENFTDKTIDKLVEEKKLNSFDYEDKSIFWLVLIVSFLIMIYIIGRTVSLKTNCVIISSIGELILLLLPIILIVILVILGMTGEKLSEKTLELLFIGSSCISLVSAIGFSIYENCYSEHPILYTIISLIIKIGLFCLIPIVLLAILCFPLKKEEKDRRYRDGTRFNQRTRNIGIIIFLFSCFAGLITSLIKEPNRKIKDK